MGNYMETCIQREDKEENPKLQKEVDQEKQELEKSRGNYGTESGRMRVKLVLTKNELEWLLLQMKNKQGKRLEDVLGAIRKSRVKGKSVATWKPSLQSIMETPEVHHEMNRSW